MDNKLISHITVEATGIFVCVPPSYFTYTGYGLCCSSQTYGFLYSECP